MDPTRFEELERLNAQIDVWIDQEEFDYVIGSFKYAPVDKEGKERNFKEHLGSAFSHDYCTNHLDEEWNDLFEVSTPPLSKFRLPSNKWAPFSKDKDDHELENAWSRFFWAKLIRAKIQQKGSDCYFRKLDQVVVYLEKNTPFVKKNCDQTNKLVVICLLEMAAAGEGTDQRSFADRARRILREHFKGKRGEEKYFYDFYDLLARYTIGLGFQHEGQNHKAVLEFNWIIKELNELWSEEGELLPYLKNPPQWASYVDKRHGLDFLYLPAVLGRTGIEIKIQLAYHALESIKKYWKSPQNDYLDAKKGYLRAEAYRLMGELEISEKELRKVAAVLCSRPPDELPKDWLKLFKKIEKVCGQKWANIQCRLLDTYMALLLDSLEKNSKQENINLEQIPDFLSRYWKFSQRQATDRYGYLELVADYLKWMVKTSKSRPKDYNDFTLIAQKIYEENRKSLIDINPEKKQGKKTCPICSELGIDLQRLGASHYQDFAANMQKFFDNFRFGKDIKDDSKLFLDRLIEVEKNSRDDLAWRKRNMVMDKCVPDNSVWCNERCIKDNTDSTKREKAFAGLLICAGNSNEDKCKRDNMSILDCEHYEHLMNHWDTHFLDHLKFESIQQPREPAIHILGLQRWNSTSPAIGRSLGGGYFIYHTDERGKVDLGVAVDPGFDFVRNFFHLGFSLSDIDVILLSHAHLDHIRDFESLVTLCLELDNRDEVKRKLQTIMTLGVYHRLSHIFESPGLREYVEPYILDIEKEIEPEFVKPYIEDLGCELLQGKKNDQQINKGPKFEFLEKERKESGDREFVRFIPKNQSTARNNKKGLRLTLTATRAYHNDFSIYSDSFGFKIHIFDKNGLDCTIGYTGDTSWFPDIIAQYNNCNVLLIHIGSLIDREKSKRRFANYESQEDCWELIKKKKHPYLVGLLHFLTEIANPTNGGKVPLVLLSEFGEELRGRIRLDLCRRLNEAYSSKENTPSGIRQALQVLPVDIGLDVILWQKNRDGKPHVKCVHCEEFVDLRQIDFETYGYDEALYCVCQTCRRSTPQNVLQDRLRNLYEVPRPLHLYHRPLNGNSKSKPTR